MEQKFKLESKKIRRQARPLIIQKAIISIIVRASYLILPIFLGNVVDAVAKNDFRNAYVVSIFMLILVLIYYISHIINAYSYNRLYSYLYQSYTKLMSERTFQNSIYSLSRFQLSEYANLLNNDIDVISGFFGNSIMRIVQICEYFFIFSYFLNINIAVFLITLIVFCLMVIVVLASGKRLEQLNKQKKKALDKKTSTIYEVFNAVKEIKGFHIFPKIEEKVEKSCSDYLKNNANYDIGANVVQYRSLIFIDGFRFILIFYSIYLISKGQLELGVIVVIYNYYQKIIDNFAIITTLNVETRNLRVSENRLNKMLLYSHENDQIIPCKYPDFKGNIIFENVTYGNIKDPILNDVSFEVKPNSLNVIVGQAGTGKTGILDLLLKMNDRRIGDILLDGITIDKIDHDTYFDLVSCVRKDPYFFDTTILENLLLVNNDQNACIELCKKLKIDDYICSLSKGYDTMMQSKEDNITIGVKHLLAIARVLLKDSKIMLFDEAFGSLYQEDQKRVITILNKLKKDHTILIITREPKVIEQADQILVVEDNQVIETGTYEELMNKKSHFQSLFISK